MRNSEQEANEDMRLVTTERERWIQVLSKNPKSPASHDAEDSRFAEKLFAAAARVKAKQPVIAPEPQEGAIQDLRTAAQAVVDRWDTPLWKDAPATALYINTLRKVLETTQPAIVPAGWQLVPIEPTQAMLDYADKTVQPVFSIGDEYRAMLAAAPPSPTPPKEPTT